MDELPRFVDDVPKQGRKGWWTVHLALLTSRPGQWALVRKCQTGRQASQQASNLRKRLVQYPDGKWEFKARTREDGTGEIYARYLADSTTRSLFNFT